ncbi:hypothetical protein COCSUDRAFT_55698 [Coccomyxa subellipsoidea C-169]|uniref:SGNH hydrolase-type esterase domain-containing protein n=1 Tax=Coccomyxa subellipsoidea (strain C-169) TaxID=574566 RepID=I0ZAP3_COCSC|nr:hypothetical protein COCSUDRAFT_55698 [Coccomyxa subellipsoidea C-169]EIE27712.1 hypothetical protein COCSUDRAFT_55698 [Coccomyxa subellipsoidea C-169]|eukprot:XP_005652256.1 hypothetical protein COCSUDRAFT_55698 [Coccomyxa subellipsoidea C-169]
MRRASFRGPKANARATEEQVYGVLYFHFEIRGRSSVVQIVLSESRCGNRVQPLEELPQVSGRRQVLRRTRHMLRTVTENAETSGSDRPALMNMANSILQTHSSLFQPQIKAETVLGALRNDFLKETLVSPEMYKQGARQWGDPSRLQQFFRKLLRGELVKVVAVGGSVTAGMGARYGNESYIQRIHTWLQNLGTEDRPVQIEFTNSAVSATTSSYTSQCVGDFVPEDADLVLVEFSVNDWETVDPATFTWMDNSLRQAL